MAHRLYLPERLSSGDLHRLNAERSHYLARVLRLKRGDRLICFDGSGREFGATVEQASGKACTLLVRTMTREQTQPAPSLHLAVGWLKGHAMDSVAQKATELGISDLWPIAATRSNVRISPERTQKRLEHWRKVVIHASEQSERLFVPNVHEPLALGDFFERNTTLATIILQPGHAPMAPGLARSPTALLVGPEGGWSDEELVLALGWGAKPHGLGEWILRAETAPLVALACVRQLWGWT